MRVSRAGALLFAALVAVRIVAVPITLAQDATDGRRHQLLTGDVRRFHKIATNHGRPYRDFKVEYPPLMLAAIDALDSSTVHDAAARLMWSQLALDLGIAAILAWGWGRRAALAYLVIGLPFVVYPFLYLRLDLLSVALALGGVALVRRRFPLAGGASLAAGCFAKLWPLLVAPVLLVRRAWRASIAFVTIGALGLAAWVAYGGKDGPIQVLTLRGARGWEIESTVGAILRGGAPVHADEGAWRFGTVPGWARLAIPVAMLAVAIAVWRLAARARPGGPGVLDGLAPLTVVVAFLVLSPLLSPQFVCWLVPYAAIAAAHGERTIARLSFVVIGLSVLLLWRIKQLIQGVSAMLVIVEVRNAALVTLLVVGVVRLVHLARRHVAVPAGELLEAAEAAA